MRIWACWGCLTSFFLKASSSSCPLRSWRALSVSLLSSTVRCCRAVRDQETGASQKRSHQCGHIEKHHCLPPPPKITTGGRARFILYPIMAGKVKMRTCSRWWRGGPARSSQDWRHWNCLVVRGCESWSWKHKKFVMSLKVQIIESKLNTLSESRTWSVLCTYSIRNMVFVLGLKMLTHNLIILRTVCCNLVLKVKNRYVIEIWDFTT